MKQKTTRLMLIMILLLMLTACNVQAGSDTADTPPEIQNSPVDVEQDEIVEAIVPTACPAQAVCEQIALLVDQNIGIAATLEQGFFDDAASGLTGAGCSISASGTGDVIANWGQNNHNFLASMTTQGWVEDMNFSGGGATGMLSTYRRDGYVCRYISEVMPVDMGLCNTDEPVTMCMDRIPPAQKMYGVSVDCSQDSYVPQEQNLPEVIQVEMPPESMTWYTPGDLSVNEAIQFVLYADVGQSLTINLDSEPIANSVLSVWGADGTLLLSNYEALIPWTIDIPSSQDYYIEVRSIAQQDILYQLTIELPPLFDYDSGAESPTETIRIEFGPGATTWYTPGNLGPIGGLHFVVNAAGGQVLNVNLATEPISSGYLVIWGADGTVLLSDGAGASSYSGVLPSSQDYYIDLRSIVQQEIYYTLSLEIPPLFDYDPAQQSSVQAVRIEFQPGATSWYTPGNLLPGGMIRFVLWAGAGQTLATSVTTEPVSNSSYSVWGADGTVLLSDYAGTEYFMQLPASQDYYIDVESRADEEITYTLNVSIP